MTTEQRNLKGVRARLNDIASVAFDRIRDAIEGDEARWTIAEPTVDQERFREIYRYAVEAGHALRSAIEESARGSNGNGSKRIAHEKTRVAELFSGGPQPRARASFWSPP